MCFFLKMSRISSCCFSVTSAVLDRIHLIVYDESCCHEKGFFVSQIGRYNRVAVGVKWLVLKCRANRRSHFRRSALTTHVSFSSVSSRQVLRNRRLMLWNSQLYCQQHDGNIISVCKVKCNETNNRWWKSKYFPPLTGCPWGPDSSGTCGQWKKEKVTNAWCGCLDWSKRWRT